MKMKKHIGTLTVLLVSILMLSGCASPANNSNSEPAKNDASSSVSSSSEMNSEAKRKTDSEVKADTDKERARYRELYPDVPIEVGISDKVTPVIQKIESNNKGYARYVVDFFEAYGVTLTIELPEQLSIRLYNENEREYASIKDMVEPFYSSAVCISDKEDNVIGGISSATIMYPDALIPGADNGPYVYQGLFTGMGYTWDYEYKAISTTETECTAISYISYPDSALKDYFPLDYARLGNLPGEGDRYFFNKAILSYNIDKLKYVAIEFDFDGISDDEWLSVAESIKLS